MGARLRIRLLPEEDRTLFEIRTAKTVPQRVKERSEVIRLNAQGWYVEKIANYFNWNRQTVRETIHRWETNGLGGLWSAEGRGGKRRYCDADIEYLEACLRQENRTDNSRQLAQKLAKERLVELSPDHLRRVLKKRGCCGSAPV